MSRRNKAVKNVGFDLECNPNFPNRKQLHFWVYMPQYTDAYFLISRRGLLLPPRV